MLIGPLHTLWVPLLVAGAVMFGVRYRRDWSAVGIGCAGIALWTWVGWWMCQALKT